MVILWSFLGSRQAWFWELGFFQGTRRIFSILVKFSGVPASPWPMLTFSGDRQFFREWKVSRTDFFGEIPGSQGDLVYSVLLQHGVIHRNVVCPYHRSNNILNYMRYMTVNISMPTRSIESSVITSSENGIRQPHGHQNGRLPSLLFAG
jgi:hypothetical protein